MTPNRFFAFGRSGRSTSLAANFLVLSLLAPCAGSLRAEEHVVSSSSLHQSLIEARQTREANSKQVAAFFAAPQVQKALKAAGIEHGKIEKAVPFLSDAELADLALQSQKMQQDVAAGALNNQQLTYIVIALATVVIVILAT